MKHTIAQILTDYGMIVVLVILCIFFSVVTYSEQFPAGESAAEQVAGMIRQSGASPRVLIAAGTTPDEIAFARKLESELKQSGARVFAVVNGQPPDARAALDRIVASGDRLDFVACTQVSASWLVFADLKSDFPKLGEPRVVQPQPYLWPNFLKSENLLNIANQIAAIAIVAVGMTMVIIAGGIDLSAGSLMAFSAVLSARLIRDLAGGYDATGIGMTLACVVAVLACGFIGTFSGAMITLFDIPPFIDTLSMLMVGSGLAYILSSGNSIYQIPDSFMWLGRGADVLNIPNAVLLMLALYVVAHVVMSRTWLGRYIYAVGGNREAARLSGVPVRRVLLFTYIASATLAGVAGVIQASLLKSGSPTYGAMYEMYVIAAVVVGGTSLSGGEGRMLGTLIGALTIAVIQNGMNLTNVESYTQKVVLGLVILGAVLVDKIRQRRQPT